MVCLLHEKPFKGVNGSGKHNNWSITTNTGKNLLDPGKTPHENAQFLLFLCAVIKAVDDYQDMLRLSVASAGNDHRLGANEAPPSIISMFLGEELTEILESIERDVDYDAKEKTIMRVGVHVLPKFAKDTTDRNRTSPFAFTGNKFEFRALGSAASISGPNIVLNTTVAESLKQFADELENTINFDGALHDLIKRTIKEHKKILFSGNGYDDNWVREAEKRGLYNLPTTPDCLPCYIWEKNVNLFEAHKVFTATEMRARYEILLDNYSKTINIEALTMLDMAKKDILPAASSFMGHLSNVIVSKKSACKNIKCTYEENVVEALSQLNNQMFEDVNLLENELDARKNIVDAQKLAEYYKDVIIPRMDRIRDSADKIEVMTDRNYWPYPSYADLLFGVR